MVCGKYYLGLDHIEEVMTIRRKVFMDEQGLSTFVSDELDETAVQAVAYKDMDHTIPVACGRMYPLSENVFKIGRVAVLKEERKQGYGDLIVRMLVDKAFLMGAEKVVVGAQLPAVGFYKTIGFVETSETYTEENVTHQVMELVQNSICRACQQH